MFARRRRPSWRSAAVRSTNPCRSATVLTVRNSQPANWSVRISSSWCGSACAARAIPSSRAASGLSIICLRWIPHRARSGVATTGMDTASMRMVRPTMGSVVVSLGRCWPASGDTTSLSRDGIPAVPQDHGGGCEPRRHAAGAGLGRARDPIAPAAARSRHGIGDATGLGARRVCQTHEISGSRPSLRPAPSYMGKVQGRGAFGQNRLLVAPRPHQAVCHWIPRCGRVAPTRYGSLGHRWVAGRRRNIGRRHGPWILRGPPWIPPGCRAGSK
jgi:hypothetical protein